VTAILGISAFYHDSAAALVVDGQVVCAAQEERFSRRKHDEAFPEQAIACCLETAGITAAELDYVGFYDKPVLKSGRLLETYLSFAPDGFRSFKKATPVWLRQKLHLPREMRRGLGGAYERSFLFLEHHESHAASAFFPSPFDEAAILTMDGVGEWATASIGSGRGHEIRIDKELRFPHSLGLLYSAFTYYTGFEVNSGEYKLMGLAPYGTPRFVDLLREKLIDLKDDGSFKVDLSYFEYCQGLTMTSRELDALFGAPPRRAHEPVRELDMDLAASIQRLTEEIALAMARTAHAETGLPNLCLAGGVALNCVANGRILHEGPFENLWIQPAAGDAGGALGTAWFIWHQLLENERTTRPTDRQSGSLLGPEWSDDELERFLSEQDATFTTCADDDELARTVAGHLDEGRVVGWFQGRMEFGPRALGARSILGDARRAEMQSTINQKVKFREGFRPFAPVVLRERAHEYFDVPEGIDSPYMLIVTGLAESKRRALTPEEEAAEGFAKLGVARSEIPAVTHVDGSARIQTVDAERHGRFHGLLSAFERRTGCPVLINTSFNLGWDPIVCTPDDAYGTFMRCDLDVLVLGRHVLTKARQPAQRDARPAEGRDRAFEERLASPCCQKPLVPAGDDLNCSACGHAFGATDGIRQLFWPHDQPVGTDVTDSVKAFYEETPFPNYDDHDTLRSLIDKSRAGVYARKLDEAIPFNARVLEVGCGTGQLTNFLGITCRDVVGSDMCLNSLLLGEAFRAEHGLDRVRFVQMNLFRPCFPPESFDVVLCNGVLHHTGDPRGGYRSLVRLLRPGGHIVVGLYNKWGRLATDARRLLIRASGGRLRRLDPYLRSRAIAPDKERAWLYDQYFHPHESKHTIDEVLDWFAGERLEFVRGVPSVTGAAPLEEVELFEPEPRGTRRQHLGSQLGLLATAGWEGGLFAMIGRKPE